MMKTKFMAGLVASIISLVILVATAICLSAFGGSSGDRFLKIIAFAIIALWLGLYAWLKPKAPVTNQNQVTENGEVKQEIKPREVKPDRQTIR